MIAINDPASNDPERDRHTFRSGIFALAFIYIGVVMLNAASVLVPFWGKALGSFPALDWTSLLGLAISTGGLGAGSLVFRSIIDKVIER